jgi:hypothetical protein
MVERPEARPGARRPGSGRMTDGCVDLALELGVPAERIDTIVDVEAAERNGVRTDGNMAGARIEVVAELATLIARGELEIPIAPAKRCQPRKADDGSRTRDLRLGKPTLYQLSYVRVEVRF